jgi:hypothetical protein
MIKIGKLIVITAVAAATPALAGEITGNGKATPIASYVANSICAFSGRNDDNSPPSSHVQSYGMIVSAFGHPPPALRPGSSCNGHSGFLAG